MENLPNCELTDSCSDEKQMVRSFMDRMAQAAKSTQDSDEAAQRILTEAYASVGFGPMITALQAYAA